MFFSRRITATLALAAYAMAGDGSGSIDNSGEAAKWLAKAVPLSGNFKITSEATGRSLTYMHDTQPNMFPSNDPLDAIMNWLESLTDISPAASQTFQLEASSKDNTVIIGEHDSQKCLSSQWNFDTGYDGYAVAYSCAVGSLANSDTGIEEAKQYYLFIPVEDDSSSSSSSGSSSIGSSAGASTDSSSSSPLSGSSSSSSDDSSSSSSSDDSSSDDDSATTTSSASSSTSTTACEKPADWVWRHPVSENEDFYRVHPECKGTAEAPECTHDKAWLERHATSEWLEENPQCKSVLNSKRAVSHHATGLRHRRRMHKPTAEKRGDGSGRYYMVLLDHLYDMETRAVSATEVAAYADAKSALIDIFDPSDESQIWTVEAV